MNSAVGSPQETRTPAPAGTRKREVSEDEIRSMPWSNSTATWRQVVALFARTAGGSMPRALKPAHEEW